MKIFSSNKLANLGAQLADRIKHSQKSIFEKDLIIVQNSAMAKWLNLKLAAENGISAQLNFPFLKNFIVGVLSKVGFKSEADLYNHPSFQQFK